jgi:phage tail-like protein
MDGLIILMDELHIPHNIWTFKRGFPVKFEGPKMKGTENAVAIESLEIAHEGLWQLSILKLGAQAIGLDI